MGHEAPFLSWQCGRANQSAEGTYPRTVSHTPYADLDELLEELLGHWRRILDDNLVGAYLQGSFALGAGDEHSDCDFLVATRRRPNDGQVAELRALHDAIPTRQVHWCHDLEGSYAPIDELASVEHLGQQWLFNNHGHRTLLWDDHCNRLYTRWILREHGVVLAGPAPRTFMAEVPAPSSALARHRLCLPGKSGGRSVTAGPLIRRGVGRLPTTCCGDAPGPALRSATQARSGRGQRLRSGRSVKDEELAERLTAEYSAASRDSCVRAPVASRRRTRARPRS